MSQNNGLGLEVQHPGVLSLIQDRGRRGHYRSGLSDGGPLDPVAFNLCQRLLQNPADASAVELTLGGARFVAQVDTLFCVCGAPMPLSVDGERLPLWQVLPVRAGQTIALGHAARGARAYLGVAGGFGIAPSFGSTATVVRENVGGLHGGALAAGDVLPCAAISEQQALQRPALGLPEAAQPHYARGATLRVIPGYQYRLFERSAKRRLFGSRYQISPQADRMGYRLRGPAVRAEQQQLLSEGICLGAIQLPPDGQPIVLLNDRQTIGGYPKIGSVLSLDLAALAQLTPGCEVVFTPISWHTARRALQLAGWFEQHRPLQPANVQAANVQAANVPAANMQPKRVQRP